MRSARRAIFSLLAVFVALEAAAMALYPGGTWWDRTTRGHDFWRNFLCDLTASTALNGTPNALGSRLAQAAMLAFVGALVPFWLVVPALFARRARLGRAVRALGLTSLAGIVAAVAMPSDRFGALHGACVVIAGVPGLAAAVVAVVGLAVDERKPRVAAIAGGATIAFALVDFALYVGPWIAGTVGFVATAALQKVAAGSLVSWMSIVAFRAESRCPGSKSLACSRIPETPP